MTGPNERPLGSGEGAQGPAVAAIANAFAAATGKRLRDLPLSPERVKAALAGSVLTSRVIPGPAAGRNPEFRLSSNKTGFRVRCFAPPRNDGQAVITHLLRHSLCFVTHYGLVVLPAVKYADNFDGILGDLVGDNDASPERHDPQIGPEVGACPALLRRIAKQIAALLYSLDKAECSGRTVLCNELVNSLEVFRRPRPADELTRHDGVLLPSFGAAS